MKATSRIGRRRGGQTRPYRGGHLAYLALAGLIVLALGAVAVHAQAGGASTLLSTGYDLTWNTVDNGGVTFSTGGGYELGGTAGQPDAAVWSGEGGYTLSGGFWGAASGGETPGGRSKVYLPVILKNRS
jgi:hypothetical protein